MARKEVKPKLLRPGFYHCSVVDMHIGNKRILIQTKQGIVAIKTHVGKEVRTKKDQEKP